MISKRIASRKDGVSSARKALRYGEGLMKDQASGLLVNKSLRTRISGFGLVDDDVYTDRPPEEMHALIELASREMQASCDLNTRVGPDKKIAHFIVSYDQEQPTEAVLLDTEASMLSALKLIDNHWASFLHNDNGHWHLHIFASRIDKIAHKGNDLWQDKTIRDRVIREIEKRHCLRVDNGMHEFDKSGQLVKLSPAEREKRKGSKPISERAVATEVHAGAQSFQSWAMQIRIGDRLKHAKSWKELHAIAVAYDCEIKPKGAGFVIFPAGEKGGIQLSKVGLKNLTARYGEFEPVRPGQTLDVQSQYQATPQDRSAQNHYQKWRIAKQAFQPIKAEQIKSLRETHKAVRATLRDAQRREIKLIRATTNTVNRFAAVSVAKMNHTFQMQELTEQFRLERKALYQSLAEQGPGNTFQTYLQRETVKGDNKALGLLRKQGRETATDIIRHRETNTLSLRAAITGREYRPTLRLTLAHRIEPNGSVVYFLGQGRQITDSAISRQVLLNGSASMNQDAIATALRFSLLKFGQSLILNGTPEFKKLAVETAVKERLQIQFVDPTLEAYRQQLINRSYPTINYHKEHSHAPYYYCQQTQQNPPAQRQSSLHDLSLGDMVLDSERDVRILRTNVPDRLEQHQAGEDRAMQRPAGCAERTGSSDHSGTGHHAGSNQRPEPRQVPVAQPETNTKQLSAEEWAEQWSREHQIPIIKPSHTGGGKVAFKVLHMADGGLVLNMGRTIAVYPLPAGHVEVGNMVVINNGQVFLQQKSKDNGVER